MNETELKAIVNEYLTNACDDIVDFARDWFVEEHGDALSDADIDTLADMVENEVRLWILIGKPAKEIPADGQTRTV